MGNVIVLAAMAALIFFAVKGIVKRQKKGGCGCGCCDGSGKKKRTE